MRMMILEPCPHTGFHVRFFEKGGGGGGGGGGGNHLTPPTYQETVPIANALTARIRLWKKIQGVFEQLHTFLLQQLSFCRCLCFKTTLL